MILIMKKNSYYHFEWVMKNFLLYVDEGSLPAWGKSKRKAVSIYNVPFEKDTLIIAYVLSKFALTSRASSN